MIEKTIYLIILKEHYYIIYIELIFKIINSLRGCGNILRIGEFSKLTGVPIRTLRYYDEIDLFKPADIDLFTDYRYYNEDQVEDLNLINELKRVGFSLEEIKNNWNNFSDEVMLKKKEELLKMKEDINESIKKLDIMRSNINNGKITKSVKSKNAYVKSLY